MRARSVCVAEATILDWEERRRARGGEEQNEGKRGEEDEGGVYGDTAG